MYSSEAIELFEQFKGLFDPDNLLNPGVLVDPRADHLGPSQAPRQADSGPGFSSMRTGATSRRPYTVVSAGKCRANNFRDRWFHARPSYQATKDEKDVTRGRARVLQDLTRGALDWDLQGPWRIRWTCASPARRAAGTARRGRYVDVQIRGNVPQVQGAVAPYEPLRPRWPPRWARLCYDGSRWPHRLTRPQDRATTQSRGLRWLAWTRADR